MITKTATDQTKMGFGQRLLVFALIFGPAIVLNSQGDPIAATTLIVIGVAALTGFRLGAAAIFLFLATGTVALWIAPAIGIALENRFAGWLETTGLTNRLISIFAVAMGILAVGGVASKLTGHRLATAKKLDAINRWLGFTLGAAEGAAAMVLLLGGILMVEPRVKQRAPLLDPDDSRRQWASHFIMQTSAKTRQSLIGPLIVNHNPFRTIPPLNQFVKLQDTVEALQDPNQIQSMLDHPSMQQLQNSFEVQQAVKELRADPKVAEILNSQQVTGTMALTLLNHPAILKLVDQPGFLETAQATIEGIQSPPVITP